MPNKIEISPADIRHKDFKPAMLGYSKTEVQDFLEVLADLFEDLYAQRQLNQNDSIAVNIYEERNQTQVALDQIQKREDLIAKTLMTAESTRNEIIRNAKAEGENIIRQAEIAAKKAIDDTMNYLNVLKHEFINLKEHRRQFLSNAHAQLRVVMERLESDPLFSKEREYEIDQRFEQARQIIKINNKDPEDVQ